MTCKLNKIIPALIVTATTGFLLSVAVDAEAASGVCSNCHVMHASEAGTAAATANDTLLRSTCIGCHTKDNGTGVTIAGDGTPGVLHNGVAANSMLAGGNFKYSDTVLGDQTYGHNPYVSGVIAADTRYTTANPPGWKATGFSANGQVGGGSPDWTNGSNLLTCAGVYGCHGLHTADELNGAHHANKTGTDIDGSTVGSSYRFLYGIIGWEDPNYELNATAANGDHNVYYAVDRSGGDDDVTTTANNSKTISYFCAECHGIFHSGAANEGVSNDASMTSPWIRHPSDVVMPIGPSSSGDFDELAAYDPNVPLGSSTVGDGTFVVGAVADRIVMCLSCHRAHASPYPASLRWDYTEMVAGDNSKSGGCFVCHDAKND
nr:cytochrome c3 family protein [Desulfobulbaceae bacterium]